MKEFSYKKLALIFAQEFINMMYQGDGCTCDLENTIIHRYPARTMHGGARLPLDYEWDGIHKSDCLLHIAEETINRGQK